MFHSRKKFAGMVLTEVLIALATLATGVIAFGTITTSSVSTTILSKDYLVATGLLNDGTQVVKVIRYTNLLLKPAETKKCWLRLVPDNLSDPSCVNNAVAGSNYISVSDKGVWQLQSASVDLDLDKNLGTNNNFQIYLNSDPKNPGYYSSLNSLNGITISKSRFFRSIKFTSLNSDSTTFEVKVQWKDGAKTREIKRTVILYNYI